MYFKKISDQKMLEIMTEFPIITPKYVEYVKKVIKNLTLNVRYKNQQQPLKNEETTRMKR